MLGPIHEPAERRKLENFQDFLAAVELEVQSQRIDPFDPHPTDIPKCLVAYERHDDPLSKRHFGSLVERRVRDEGPEIFEQ